MGGLPQGGKSDGCLGCQVRAGETWPSEGVIVLYRLPDEAVAALSQSVTLLRPIEDGPWVLPYGEDLPDVTALLEDVLAPAQLSDTLAAVGDIPATDVAGIVRLMGGLQSLSALLARQQDHWLQRLLEGTGLISHLQPIVRIRDGQVYGYEALMRGQLDGGVRMPAEILARANDAGQLPALDRLARQAAIQAKVHHLSAGHKIVVNVLPSAIYDPPSCLAPTFAMMQQHGVAATDVVVDIVESERIHDLSHLRRLLDHYRDQGIAVALDDLGTGHATLQMISTLQPDMIKVDRQLIDGIHRQPAQQAVVEGIVRFCQDLGVISVAEGIETPEDYTCVASLGFDLAQGYLIGRPSPAPGPGFVGTRPLQPAR